MRSPSLPTTLLVASLIATAFAGCLSSDTSGDPAISRVHTLTLSRSTLERAGTHGDDPMAALRELLTTDIVVRVQAEGDYVVEYTDVAGDPKSQTLTGATPGTPVTISGADPISPITLKRGEETVSVRGGVSATWWHMGDFPLGFNLTESSKSRYDFRSRVQETFTLSDIDVAEAGIRIEDARFDLRLPMEGSASWELQPDAGEGSPVLLSADLRIPPASDLLTFDVVATQEGTPGTAGVVAGVTEATARATGKLWVRDNEPIAAQFTGAQAKLTPSATMWADGFFAELAGEMSCSGKSKSDGCQPTEIQTFDETVPAGEKEVFDETMYPRAEDDDDREAIALMRNLFAQDILPGDKAIVIGLADSEDFAAGDPNAPSGDARFEFSIEALQNEEITVPAGTFQTLKIIEELRTRVNLNEIHDPEGTPVLSTWSMDETIARTTFWLDARTYQPVKMDAQMPFDADALLKSIFNAIEPAAWDKLGGEPIDDSQWSVSVVAESSYELGEFQPGAHFSALVGLALAHAVTGTMGAPLSMAFMGFGGPMFGADEHAIAYPDEYSTDYNYSTEYPEYPSGEYPDHAIPARSLSLSSTAPAAGGLKSYTIESVSPDLMWGELMATLDDEGSYLEVYDTLCQPPEQGFTVCGEAQSRGWDDVVAEGDVVTFVAEPGQTLRIIDAYANAVILTLVVS